MAFDESAMYSEATRLALLSLKDQHMDEYMALFDGWMTVLRNEQMAKDHASSLDDVFKELDADV